MKDNVAVIGAGTSGLIAARRLASLGIRTRVYDQKTRLGYPAKASGIISISGLKSLEVGYEKAITNTLFGANIHSGDATMRIVSKKPEAHVLDREKLNGICSDEAEAVGAKISRGEKVDGARLDGIGSESIIVGADGPVSSVARHFSMGAIERYTLTYKAEFEVSAPDPRMVDLFFDSSIAPKFFAWLCPNSKSVLEVGIGIGGKNGNSKAAFDRFVRLKEVAQLLDGARMIDGYASLIPMQTARKVVDAEREVLLVGDAAGQVKPTTGGGIVFGGNAAIIAADVIESHIKRGTGLGEYEKRFRKAFGKDIALHGVINSIYSNLAPSRLAFLISVFKALGFESFFSKYGDMDRPSTMLKRFFLRGLAK
ncbi:MAG: NAD(P)/FAD-dependent oxidoreductase [Candidatus Micrarchaeota archaeon]|nr:NAD(P)/FAD-dependent oxidoreductase [Candidatus Micrarchaeota archaeon]